MNFDKAQALANDNKWDEALILLQEIVESSTEPAGVKAKAWRLISTTKREQLELDQARHALDKALRLYLEAGDEEEELDCRLQRAHDDVNYDRYLEAEHALTRIMDRADSGGYRRIKARAHNVRGTLHRHRNELAKSVGEYVLAIDIFTDLGLEDETDALSMNLAKVYVRQGRFDLAKPYYERGTEYYAKLSGRNTSIIQRMGVANTAWLVKNYQLAEDLYRELLPELKDHDSGFITSIVQQGLGMLLLARCDYKNAKKHLLLSLNNISQGEHRKLRVALLTALAIICVIVDEPDEALSYALLSRDNCFDNDDVESRLIAYYLAIVYLANNKHELAVPFWESKQLIDWTIEMELEYEWMGDMLKHILADEYAAVMRLSAETKKLAEDWLVEVNQLNEQGRATTG